MYDASSACGAAAVLSSHARLAANRSVGVRACSVRVLCVTVSVRVCVEG
jgi:hypothetical protein